MHRESSCQHITWGKNEEGGGVGEGGGGERETEGEEPGPGRSEWRSRASRSLAQR